MDQKKQMITQQNQLLYTARENRTMFSMVFDVVIRDAQGLQVFILTEKEKFFVGHTLEINGPMGFLGSVRQETTFFTPEFTVRDANKRPIFIIKGNWLDFDFQVVSCVDGRSSVGKIAKHLTWINNKYTVVFPLDMHVNMKALLIGAVFAIQYKHERSKR